MKHRHSALIRFRGDSTLWNDQRKKMATSHLWQLAGISQGTIHGAIIALELDRHENFVVTLGVFTNERDIHLTTVRHKKADVAIHNACQRLQCRVQQPQLCPA